MRLLLKICSLLVVIVFLGNGGQNSALASEDEQMWRQSAERWIELIAESEELYREGHYSEAAPVAEQALKIARSFTAYSLADVFGVYTKTDRVTDAEAILQEAQAQLKKALGPNHPILVEMYQKMAACCRRTGKLDKAKEYENLAKQALSGQ